MLGASAATVGGLTLLSPAGARAAATDTYRNLNLFGDVFEKIRSDYVERPDEQKLVESAINGMLTSLDPHSSYMDPKSYRDMQVQTRGEFGGLGIEVTQEEGLVKVVTPIDDTPASRAGIMAGDLISAIDDEAVLGLTLNQAVDKMRGPVNTSVKLTVLRGAQKEPREVKLTRAVIQIKSVRSRQEGDDIGYIRITQFSEPVPELTDLWLRRFAGQGDGNKGDSPPVEGVILDLRNNSGGLVSAGVAVANSQLDNKGIVETQDRGGIKAQQSANAGALYSGPLLTLINGGSASASEILAGALQDAGRSTLAGSRSFGKGLIQSLLSLGDGSGLAVSVARYRTPLGREIQSIGLTPDHPLPQPEPLTPGGTQDTWLGEAQRLLIDQLGPEAGAN
jgi:carboxyl-terminal processing protease